MKIDMTKTDNVGWKSEFDDKKDVHILGYVPIKSHQTGTALTTHRLYILTDGDSCWMEVREKSYMNSRVMKFTEVK